MVRQDLLDILCCPESRQALHLAEPALVEELNRKIAARQVRNRAGEALGEPLDSGLVRADKKLLYPVRGDIPILLIDEAIPLDA